jgi:hypothetical protein
MQGKHPIERIVRNKVEIEAEQSVKEVQVGEKVQKEIVQKQKESQEIQVHVVVIIALIVKRFGHGELCVFVVFLLFIALFVA